MFTQNEYVQMQLNQDAYDAAFQEAKKQRMLRQAGLVQPGSALKLACQSAASLGRLLISLGRRLEQLDTVRATQQPLAAD